MTRYKFIITFALMTIFLSLLAFVESSFFLDTFPLFPFFLTILIIINYSPKKNLKAYTYYSVCLVLNLFVFVGVKYSKGCKFSITNPDFYDIVYMAYSLTVAVFTFCCLVAMVRQKVTKEGAVSNLFNARAGDLNRLSEYLETENIVGINGDWGTGKSFLCRMLEDKKKEEREGAEFVYISVIALKAESVQSVIIRELSKILERNGIFSFTSKKLQSLIKCNSFAETFFASWFSGDKGFDGTLADFSEDVKKLDKIIYLVFEDLDRIADAELIKNILEISLKLVSTSRREEYNSASAIKVIYQYSSERLSGIGEGLSVDYIQKYIPFSFPLSNIDFLDNVHKELNVLKPDNISVADFEFLTKAAELPEYLCENISGKGTGMRDVIIKFAPIRDVKSFLRDVLKYAKDEKFKDSKQIVITFFAMKHFKPEVFEVVEKYENPLYYEFLCGEARLNLRFIMANTIIDNTFLFGTPDLRPISSDNEENLYVLFFLYYFGYGFSHFCKPAGKSQFPNTMSSQQYEDQEKSSQITKTINALRYASAEE